MQFSNFSSHLLDQIPEYVLVEHLVGLFLQFTETVNSVYECLVFQFPINRLTLNELQHVLELYFSCESIRKLVGFVRNFLN